MPGEGPTLRIGAACKAWCTTGSECGCACGACRLGDNARPGDAAGRVLLTAEQFDWLVAGLPWQRLSASPKPITVV